MNAQRFEEILAKRQSAIEATLAHKSKEYGLGDRLHNFKVAAAMQGTTPENALLGMLAKHLVSVVDLCQGRLTNTEQMANEKIGDAINYLILLEAVLDERRGA